MTSVVLSPRMESTASDTESILNFGRWQIRPSRPYQAGGQWVQDIWTPPAKFTGVAVTLLLDSLVDVPYELYMEIPNGKGNTKKVTEFRLVPASGPVNWEDCLLVDGPGANPVPTNVVNARLDALEAANPSGGASTLLGITDMSAFARGFNNDPDAATFRISTGTAAAGAAPTAHTHVATTDLTATGTKTSATFLRGDNTWASPPAAGSPDWVDITGKPATFAPVLPIAQASVTNLVTDLASKISGSGATLTNVTLTGSVTAPAGSLPVSTLTDIVTYLATTWGQTPTLYATSATVWPATRTVPAGYSGPVRWDSTAFNDAVSPTAMVIGDRWRRRISAAGAGGAVPAGTIDGGTALG